MLGGGRLLGDTLLGSELGLGLRLELGFCSCNLACFALHASGSNGVMISFKCCRFM